MKPHSRPISVHRRAATLALVLAGAASACRGEKSPDVEPQIEQVTQAIVTPNCPYREVVAFEVAGGVHHWVGPSA